MHYIASMIVIKCQTAISAAELENEWEMFINVFDLSFNIVAYFDLLCHMAWICL